MVSSTNNLGPQPSDPFLYRLTASDQEVSASTLNSHLVHPAIIDAGKKWSNSAEVNPLIRQRFSTDSDADESDDRDMSQPIGVRGEDIGLRCLRIQGEFSLHFCESRSLMT